METIIRILMRRDGLTRDEAKDTIEVVQEMVDECIETGNLLCMEDIIRYELGLEPDYVEFFIPV